MRKRLAAVFSLAVLAMSACAPASEDGSKAGAAGVYRIVHLLGTNQPGPAALNAQAAAQAAKAAVAVLNEKGGILGKKVELEAIDTGGDPTTAVTKLQQRLQTGPKPNLVLPGNTSAEAVPMAPIITSAGILSVQQASASALDDLQKFPYLFKVTPTPESMAAQLVTFVQSQQATKIAMIAGKDAFAQATAEATRKAVAAAGLTLSGDETYTAQDLEMTAQLERLRAGKPDILFMQGAGASVGYVLDSRLKIGWTDTPLVADSTSAVTSLLSRPKPDGLLGTPAVKNVYVQVLTAAIKGSPEVNPGAMDKMVAAVKAQGPIPLPLNTYFVYDAIMLASAASEKAGTIDDAARLAKTLEGFTGTDKGMWALSRYAYSSKSHAVALDPHSTKIIPAQPLVVGRYEGTS